MFIFTLENTKESTNFMIFLFQVLFVFHITFHIDQISSILECCFMSFIMSRFILHYFMIIIINYAKSDLIIILEFYYWLKSLFKCFSSTKLLLSTTKINLKRFENLVTFNVINLIGKVYLNSISCSSDGKPYFLIIR